MSKHDHPMTEKADIGGSKDRRPQSIPLQGITVEEDKKAHARRSDASGLVKSSYEFAGLLKHLEIKHPSGDEQLKLSTIWDYVKGKAKGKSDQDAILEYVKLKNKLGAPRVGESSIDRVYRYIKIKKQQQILKEEAKSV